jgi:CHASE2 domain-containing sensor protein
MRKPFHQHLLHHVKKYHSHITKYLYERDTILATAWVFTFILLVKIIPMPNIHFFDPVEIALEDFDFNDITYSKLKGPDNYDPRVVIVNIGEADREELAMLIEKTASFKPRVMALDVTMSGARDPVKDSLLRKAIEANPNLILASRFIPGKGKIESEYIDNYFNTPATKQGYVNFFNKEWATVRIWNPFEKAEKGKERDQYKSFATIIVEQYDSLSYLKLKKRKNKTESINYTRHPQQYHIIEPEDLFEEGKIDSALIRNKIVLLGYINLNAENIEDKKYTPMNEEFAGKSIPDMNGIVVHANIISMVLDSKYINKLPLWVNILVALLVGWLHMSFFIRYYLENHIWFHLVAKFAQLLSAIFFVYIGIYFFDKFRMKLDMTLTIVVIVLAVDIIYFYEAFAVWLHKKFGYKTVFHQKHH